MDGVTAVRAKEELQQAFGKAAKMEVERNTEGEDIEHGVKVIVFKGEPDEASRTFWSLESLQLWLKAFNDAREVDPRANQARRVREDKRIG